MSNISAHSQGSSQAFGCIYKLGYCQNHKLILWMETPESLAHDISHCECCVTYELGKKKLD